MNDLEFVEEGDTLFHRDQAKLQHQEQDEEVKRSLPLKAYCDDSYCQESEYSDCLSHDKHEIVKTGFEGSGFLKNLKNVEETPEIKLIKTTTKKR